MRAAALELLTEAERPFPHSSSDESWAELARAASEPNVFSEPWFVRSALCFLGGERVRLVDIADEDGALIGVIPLCLSPRYGRLPVPHLTNWMHSQCFLGTPLVRAGHERSFWRRLLELLDDAPWARGFLHLHGLVEGDTVHRGLADAAKAMGRPCDVVHRTERALLQSDLSPDAYYEQTVRKKKRKELKRLQSRLAELGAVEYRRLGREDELEPWGNAFLALERGGWKGEAGTALACTPSTERFFRTLLADAFRQGCLDFVRMDLDGRPIAMLINFLAPPGSFSFKIAYDEAFARFSPGILIQLENLRILDREEIGWMDSCAVENHPMINSLWAERRKIVRVTVPLAGAGRRTLFHLCRSAERASAALRKRPDSQGHDDDE